MSLSSNALCAKAKSMYGGRLNKNIYLDLTRKQTSMYNQIMIGAVNQ